jgi:hypothetical protein
VEITDDKVGKGRPSLLPSLPDWSARNRMLVNIDGDSGDTGTITPPVSSPDSLNEPIDCSQLGEIKAVWQLGSAGRSRWSAILRNSRPMVPMPIPQSVN